MSSRLNLKYGLVAEHDRLSSSADTLSVTQPATGSKTRTKGDLYVIVSSSTVGGRARDATATVAESIRREYYYDESAGIPIILEKCFRSAERRLRGRDGHGIATGSIGIALAVIRGTELYVATTGPAEAYLVRAARLLMPEHDPGPGLPAGNGLRLDVWRGEFAVGDSLLLVSRDLTEVVGTEELKNAVVTLHPQSAVEHLHHLFVAAGGEGSDAVLAIEATEEAAPRSANRLIPVAEPEDYPELAGGAPQIGGGVAASAVTTRAIGARDAVGDAIGGLTDRLADLIPGRRRQYRRITPRVSRRESQRRAAIAFLAFLAVIAFLGVALALFPRGTEQAPPDVVGAGEAAYLAALRLTDQVEDDELVTDDPDRALELLRRAWLDLERAAETGVEEEDVAPLRTRIASGLDRLYGGHRMTAVTVARITGGDTAHDARDLVRGPDDAAYVVDREARTVVRIDPETGASAVIVTAGDGGGEGIHTPLMLARGGPDLLITDLQGNLWRWRPSDDSGRGTLSSMSVGGDVAWGDDILDIGTFPLPGSEVDYRLYVADPSSEQILSYPPLGDGSGFGSPSDYLTTEGEVGTWRQIHIDGDILALTADDVIRHLQGSVQAFELSDPPDDADLRPDHEYVRFAGTGAQGSGRLYIWDRLHERIVVFQKGSGRYIEQWAIAPGGPSMADVRGLYVIEPAVPVAPSPSPATPGEEPAGPPATLIWLTPDALMRSELIEVAGPAPGVTPSVVPSPTEASPPVSTPRPCRPGTDPPRPRGCVPTPPP